LCNNVQPWLHAWKAWFQGNKIAAQHSLETVGDYLATFLISRANRLPVAPFYKDNTIIIQSRQTSNE
jgi:hypothetical protein